MEQIAVLARRALKMGAVTLWLATLAGCGGGDGGAEPAPPALQAPTITAQPSAASVAAGATATFTVAASGTSPLGYLWRRNGTPIAGATESSYTTTALSVADSGASFSVVVSNAAGSVTSAEALLTVTPALVAPVITTQPQPVTVNAGQVATFTVAATGSAPLVYQWRRNGVDIAGANGASYTTAALAVADNGAVFSARVGNAAGAVVSGGAALTVLAPRAWAAGQLLETGDTPVEVREEGIDDEGRVTVALLKTEAARATLYATRGTPGSAGSAPTWTTPAAVDNVPGLAGTAANTEGLRLAVAPSGHAAVLFTRRAPCTAATYSTSGTCVYRYVSRFLADGTGWEAPVLAGDAPGATSASDVTLRINDAGDIVFIGTGWVRAGTGTFSARLGTWRRARSAAGFTVQNVAETTLDRATARLGLDGNGQMLLVAEAAQNATTDIVAYRGDMTAGFGAQAVLDNLGNAASLVGMAVGRNGHQAVIWVQGNGVQSRYFAANSETAAGAWLVSDLALVVTTLDKRVLVVSDTGTATFHDLFRRKVWRRVAAGTWSGEVSLPADAVVPNNDWDCAVARNGDTLCTKTGGFNQNGNWSTYDAANNVLVKAPASSSAADYVLGVDTINRGIGYSFPLLAGNGIGFMSLRNGFDVLPTEALPAGQSRAVSNLWGVYLR